MATTTAYVTPRPAQRLAYSISILNSTETTVLVMGKSVWPEENKKEIWNLSVDFLDEDSVSADNAVLFLFNGVYP
jgi:hypothetical protein